MRLSIIVIGDEILLGQVIDTNSGEIARTLGPLGWEIVETTVAGDNAASIEEAVDRALAKSDLVITTGGLGPTKDDITKSVLMRIFGGELMEDADVLANVERVFARRGLKLNALTKSQALVPTSCRVIQNEFGTAPIMWFEKDGKALIAMPGVPFETVGMLHKAIVGEIRSRFQPSEEYLHHTFIACGTTESAMSEHLTQFESSLPGYMHLAYLPVPGYIRLRLDAILEASSAQSKAEKESLFDDKVKALADCISQWLIYDGDATPAEIVLQKLKAKGLSLSTAESCTGGNIAHHITSIAGSSQSFLGGVVSYANSVKENVLGVCVDDIEVHGAVSEPVVRQMAEGACRCTGSDCSVATSGIAGPGGAVAGKPVGTVWIAACVKGNTIATLFHFPGNRERVIERATNEALLMLAKML